MKRFARAQHIQHERNNPSAHRTGRGHSRFPYKIANLSTWPELGNRIFFFPFISGMLSKLVWEYSWRAVCSVPVFWSSQSRCLSWKISGNKCGLDLVPLIVISELPDSAEHRCCDNKGADISGSGRVIFSLTLKSLKLSWEVSVGFYCVHTL